MFKFKTNIKCGGCIAVVTPELDRIAGKGHWEVDTALPERLLTVTGDESSLSQKVIEGLKSVGYQAELI